MKKYFSNDEIMAEGDDDRITIDERSGLNKYGCSPYPKNFLSYASSTASSLTNASFDNVSSCYDAHILKEMLDAR